MFASIQSKQYHEFYCHIEAEAVYFFKNILVYELVDSVVPDDIVKTVNGEYSGTFRHVALDTEGNGYLFDFKNKKIDASVGKCTYTAD
jgi:hypothetical protein